MCACQYHEYAVVNVNSFSCSATVGLHVHHCQDNRTQINIILKPILIGALDIIDLYQSMIYLDSHIFGMQLYINVIDLIIILDIYINYY